MREKQSERKERSDASGSLAAAHLQVEIGTSVRTEVALNMVQVFLDVLLAGGIAIRFRMIDF